MFADVLGLNLAAHLKELGRQLEFLRVRLQELLGILRSREIVQ